jgi:hypothetical protein
VIDRIVPPLFIGLLTIGGLAVIAYELRTGNYLTRSGKVATRAEHPVYFFLSVALHVAGTAAVAYLGLKWTLNP